MVKSTEHSAILEIEPDDATVTAHNEEEIANRSLGQNEDNKTTSDLKVGDKVRVNIRKNDANSNGTDPKWSSSVYEVQKTQGQIITINNGMRQTIGPPQSPPRR